MAGSTTTTAAEDALLRADRRRYWRAGAVGGLLAFIVFVLILLHGEATVFRSEPLSGFYDLQAHSLVHLRWDVPAGLMGIEGFHIGSRTYEYFGPWPAILRLPIAALTHAYDGELTQLSMMLAFVVALVATTRLAWRARVMARGSDPVTRAEAWTVGAFVFLIGAGSCLLFFSSRLLVFHEAGIWGVALSLAAFEWVLAYATSQRTAHLVAACGLITLALSSRVSVGMGPLFALGLVLVAGLGAPTRRLLGLPEQWDVRRSLPRITVALLIPVLLYTSVNFMKFRTPVGVPFDKQVITRVSAEHRAVLRANNNSMIGLQFVPTVLTQYLRPDAIRLSPLFPWVTFPPHADVIGNVSFDHIEPTPSIPATMPALAALAIVGLVGIFRRRREGRPNRFSPVRTSIVGATFAMVPSLAFGFVAQRYLGDALPLLVLGAVVGVQVLLAWSSRRAGAASVRFAWGGLAFLMVLSLWFNAGLAVLYQRGWGYKVPRNEIVDLVNLQYSVHKKVSGGSPPHLLRGAKLPLNPPAGGDVFAVGSCAGLYWSNDGRFWVPLERTNDTGLYKMRGDFSKLEENVPAPLLAVGRPGAGVVFALRRMPSGLVRAELFTEGKNLYVLHGKPFPMPDGPGRVTVLFDHQAYGEISVVASGNKLLNVNLFKKLGVFEDVHDYDRVAIGQGLGAMPTAATFPGGLTSQEIDRDFCRKVAG